MKTLLLVLLLVPHGASAAFFKSKVKTAPTTAAAPKPQDPLRPLSTSEITTAVAAVREAGVFSSSVAFALVALREAPKGEPAAARQVQLVVVDDDRKETSEAVVDLDAKRLSSWRLLAGFAPAREKILAPEAAVSTASAVPPAGGEVELEEGGRVRWDKWRLRVAAHPRDGLVVSHASFAGRSVLYRGSASEIAVIREDGPKSGAPAELVEAGLSFGRRARTLEPRADAPGDAAFLDAAFADEAGAPFVVRRAVAVFPRRNLSGGRELVARFSSRAGGRDYAQVWVFSQNGEITGRVEVSGSTTAAEAHLFSYRLDLDVDGATGTVKELGFSPAPGRPLIGRRLEVSSAVGEGGYAVVPGEGLGAPDGRKAAFASRAFWALPYNPDQQYAAGEYPSSGRPDGLERWSRAEEPLDGRDVVVWHSFSAVALPGDRAAASFRLVPVHKLLTPAL